MARKTRKQSITSNNMETKSLDKKTYKAAIYARLSIKNDNSESIYNQIKICKNYIEKQNDIELIKIYSDDGKTGTNFERESFESLINDVRKSKIDCIIVKDLSRFGRNYIEAGNYIEKIFPYLGIRFIAISDNFDSKYNNNDMLFVSINNVLNDYYSKDISEKTKSSLITKQKEGKFLGGTVPYGYKRSDQNKYKLVIDEKAAEVIKKIFSLTSEGYGTTYIAKYLNSKKIVPPNKYKGLKKGAIIWLTATVNAILKNEVYTGCVIARKNKRASFSSNKYVPTLPDERIIVEGTHEAIIDKNLFNIVQNINKMKIKREQKPSEHSTELKILKGKIYCGYCNQHLKLCKNGNKYWYKCSTYENGGIDYCSLQSFLWNYVFNTVYTTIKIMVEIMDIKKNNTIYTKSPNIVNDNIVVEKRLLFQKYSQSDISEEEYKKQLKILNKTEENINDREKNINIEFKKENITKELIELLIDNVKLYDEGKMEINFKFKDLFL